MTVAETVSRLRGQVVQRALLTAAVATTLWALLRHVWAPTLPETLFAYGPVVAAALCAVFIAIGQVGAENAFRALEQQPDRAEQEHLYGYGIRSATNASLNAALLACGSGWLTYWEVPNVFMLGISLILFVGRFPGVSHARRTGLRD